MGRKSLPHPKTEPPPALHERLILRTVTEIDGHPVAIFDYVRIADVLPDAYRAAVMTLKDAARLRGLLDGLRG